MYFKESLKKNKLVYKIWNKRNKYRLKKIDSHKLKSNYKFENRCNNYEDVCIILAGYKQFLWNDVFSRIKEYIPNNIDVCVVSAGKYDIELSRICEKNQWSYLSLKENKVTLAQNVAINLFPAAKLIYKLDEDIFITKGFFEQLKETLVKIQKEKKYRPSIVAPLINVNGYCYIKILEKIGILDEFEKKFGNAYYDASPFEPIVRNGEIAKYLWGSENETLRNIDKLSKKFFNEDFSYSVCPIRYSIGAILMPRKTWEDMNMFSVGEGVNLGVDEEELCSYSICQSRPIIVSENILVGHFSYGPQTETMKQYYEENKDIFKFRKG